MKDSAIRAWSGSWAPVIRISPAQKSNGIKFRLISPNMTMLITIVLAGCGSATVALGQTKDLRVSTTEEIVTFETSDVHVVLSNRGAVVRSWVLKRFKDAAGKPLELVNQAGSKDTGYPFSLKSSENMGYDVNNLLWVAHTDGKQTIRYELSYDLIRAKKTFTFNSGGSVLRYSDDVSLSGGYGPVHHYVQWRGGFGDIAARDSVYVFRYDTGTRRLVLDGARAARNGPIMSSGVYAFAGIEDLCGQ